MKLLNALNYDQRTKFMRQMEGNSFNLKTKFSKRDPKDDAKDD